MVSRATILDLAGLAGAQLARRGGFWQTWAPSRQRRLFEMTAMTKDFRHIGLTSADHATAEGATAPAAISTISMVLPNHQCLILRVADL